MRTFLILFALTFSTVALAEDNSTTVTPTAAKPAASQTQHNFEDLLVQGKYHFSDEAVTTVEDDKVLDALIGVRADFKDRIKQSSGLY